MNIAFGAVSCIPLGATAARSIDTDILTPDLTRTVDNNRLLPVLSTRVDDVRTGVTMPVRFRWLGLDALPVGCLDELGRNLPSVIFFCWQGECYSCRRWGAVCTDGYCRGPVRGRWGRHRSRDGCWAVSGGVRCGHHRETSGTNVDVRSHNRGGNGWLWLGCC